MGPPNYSGWFVIDTLDNTEYELGSVEDGSRKECRYPDHAGKAKPDCSINKLQSKIIFHELKNLVPVGSGKIKLFVLM